MQDATSIASSDKDQTAAYPDYVIVGSTSNGELSALLDLLSGMGARMLSPAEDQRWSAALADQESVVVTVEGFAKKLGASRKPLLLPTTFRSDMKSFHQVVAQLHTAMVMLFYTRPEPLLMQALAEATSPADALEKWCTVSRCMLEVVHQHRKRAVLFEADSAFKGTTSFKSVCLGQFGLESGSGNEVAIPTHESAAELHRLIAAQMVAQSTDVQDLLNELEASAMPSDLPPAVAAVNCEVALAEWCAKGESNQLKEENELLLLQVHQVQDELESYCLELRESEKKLKSKDAAIERLDRAIEIGNRKFEAHRAKMTELQRTLVETQDALTRIRQSLSWKMTKPLRGVRAFLRPWSRKQRGT